MSNTVSDYLEELVSQKSALAANLTAMGVSASSSEKLNTLVPKVLEIEGESDYELLEYIQSDGTQAINTGIVIQTPSTLYFDFSPLSPVEFRWLAGVEIDRGTNLNTYIGIVLMPETRHYRVYSGASSSSSSQYTEYSNIVFDGTKRYRHVINAKSLSSSNSLFIFGLNRVEGTEYNLGSAKLYMTSINDRYLLPARRKSDGICGLWDTVANQFLTDSLNGNPFVAGPKVNLSSGNILSGATVPSASLGNDGDIYKQVIPIPNDVNFVEYLESSETQYIDTGIIPTENTSFIVDFTNQAQLNVICGGRVGSGNVGTADFHYGVQITNTNNNFDKLIADFGTGGRTSGIQISYGRHVVETGKVKKLDGSIIAKRDYGSSYTIEDNVSVYLFAINSSTGGTTFGKSKIHRVLHLENGIITHDYLPCLDENSVACMWENVTQQYIYNSGTGVFSHGNTVNPDTFPVYFLKKNGAWILIQQ